MTDHVVGLDIGSTYLKAVLLRTDGAPAHETRRHTPWHHLPGGRAEMDAAVLLTVVADLLAELADAAVRHGGRVVGIGVSGMAEAGVLIDDDGRVALPIPAWFDPRGDAEVARLDPDFAAEFPRRTGLSVGPLATFAKLLHARANGVRLAGRQWLNLPEYVAHALGGGRFGEPSLRSRTGLVDQDTGEVWPPPLALLDAPADLLPPRRAAGEPWGTARRVPPALRGAVLTVAGHDHLVASVGASCVDRGDLYNSIGTAEALLRVVAGTLDGDTRARLAAQGVSVGAHLLPGRGVLLAGLKTGLILRRVLQLIGVTDAAGRAALDDRLSALGSDLPGAHALRVTGADNTDGVLAVRADGDELSPELFFATALEHSTQVLVEVLGRVDAAVGPADRTVLSGGWCTMAAIRRSRAAVLPRVQVSERIEATVYGAGLVAAFACLDSGPDRDLVAFARAFGTEHEPAIGKGSTR